MSKVPLYSLAQLQERIPPLGYPKSPASFLGSGEDEDAPVYYLPTVTFGSPYRGTSLIRNTHPPRITIGP